MKDLVNVLLKAATPSETIMSFDPDKLDLIMIRDLLKNKGFTLEADLPISTGVYTQVWESPDKKFRVDVRCSNRRGITLNIEKMGRF